LAEAESLVHGMARIGRHAVRAYGRIEATVLLEALRAVMTGLAQALHGIEAEAIPVAFVRHHVIDHGRDRYFAVGCAELAKRLLP